MTRDPIAQDNERERDIALRPARSSGGPFDLHPDRGQFVGGQTGPMVAESIIGSRRAYVVQANRGGRQWPTFYLLADVQGITNAEQAERIARDILGLMPRGHDATGTNVSVMETTLP